MALTLGLCLLPVALISAVYLTMSPAVLLPASLLPSLQLIAEIAAEPIKKFV